MSWVPVGLDQIKCLYLDGPGPDSRVEYLIQGIKPIIQVKVKPLPVLPHALETLLYNNNMSLIVYFIHISWATVYLVVDPTGSGHRPDRHLCPERVSIPIVLWAGTFR